MITVEYYDIISWNCQLMSVGGYFKINFDKDLSPAFTSLAFFLNGFNSGQSGITSARLFFLEDVLGTTREF